MNEPSQYVKNIIESRSVVRPESITPGDFRNLWGKARGLVGDMAVQLTRHDADFKDMSEKSAELVDLVARLRVADADLRRETTNGKRPRSYPHPEIDHAPEIEVCLLRALSCIHRGDDENNMNLLYRSAGDARDLVYDAWSEFQKTRVR